jgi:hypothetical protein
MIAKKNTTRRQEEEQRLYYSTIGLQPPGKIRLALILSASSVQLSVKSYRTLKRDHKALALYKDKH